MDVAEFQISSRRVCRAPESYTNVRSVLVPLARLTLSSIFCDRLPSFVPKVVT